MKRISRTKIDYLPLASNVVTFLRISAKIVDRLSRCEMPLSMRRSFDAVRQYAEGVEVEVHDQLLENVHKDIFESMMVNVSEIEDVLREILVTHGDVMKKLANLPVEQQFEIADALGIELLGQEKEKVPPKIKQVVFRLLDEIHKLQDISMKYYSLDKEGYLEFEDEV